MSTLKVTYLQNENGTGPAMSIAVGGGVTFAGISTFYGAIDLQTPTDLRVAAGATISGSTNEVIVRTADASSTALRLRSDGGGTNGGHLEGEGPKITFDAKRGNDGANSSASYIQQVAIGDLGSSWPVDLAFGVRRFGSSFEALRIASTGNVGIGTDNPTSKLQVDGTVRSGEGYTVYPPSDSNYAFATRNSADDQWTAFIEANGKATFAGNVVLSTAGTGINFSAYATSGNPSSNLLDDYEEGTFTPTVTGLGNATVMTLNSNIDTMRYVKVGRKVTIFGRVQITSINGATGAVQLGSLPFISDNTGPDESNFNALQLILHGFSLPANGNGVVFAELQGNAATANIYCVRDNNSWTNLDSSNVNTSPGAYLYVTGSYFADS